MVVFLVFRSPSLRGTVGAREAAEEGKWSQACSSTSGRSLSSGHLHYRKLWEPSFKTILNLKLEHYRECRIKETALKIKVKCFSKRCVILYLGASIVLRNVKGRVYSKD